MYTRIGGAAVVRWVVGRMKGRRRYKWHLVATLFLIFCFPLFKSDIIFFFFLKRALWNGRSLVCSHSLASEITFGRREKGVKQQQQRKDGVAMNGGHEQDVWYDWNDMQIRPLVVSFVQEKTGPAKSPRWRRAAAPSRQPGARAPYSRVGQPLLLLLERKQLFFSSTSEITAQCQKDAWPNRVYTTATGSLEKKKKNLLLRLIKKTRQPFCDILLTFVGR